MKKSIRCLLLLTALPLSLLPLGGCAVSSSPVRKPCACPAAPAPAPEEVPPGTW